jgi:hypothetical protein
VAGAHATHAAVPAAYVPIGHVEEVYAQVAAPAVLYAPAAAHGVHAAAPADDQVPAGQGIGSTEESGQ